MFSRPAVIYGLLWLFIGMASSFDLYLAVANCHELKDIEQNPVGTWLIDLDDGGIGLFMGLKMAGTVTALGVLILLYHLKRNWALVISYTLSAGQVLLILYLVLA